MIIGKYSIHRASVIKKLLQKSEKNESEKNLVAIFIGIYVSRKFGLCIYRTDIENDINSKILNNKIEI
ncbi:MAG: hypothetical protein IPO21_14350 [Bacteroidales bacterium]|nr:hypothetical protein [Bacteroidales bacterium]